MYKSNGAESAMEPKYFRVDCGWRVGRSGIAKKRSHFDVATSSCVSATKKKPPKNQQKSDLTFKDKEKPDTI